MELEQYKPKHHRAGKKMFIFLLFLFVISLIVFTTVYNVDTPFTGRIIQFDTNSSVKIGLESNAPETNLKGDYQTVIIEGLTGPKVIISEKTISLNQGENKLEIYGFSGQIKLDGQQINLLDGKTTKIVLNGIDIEDTGGKKIRIYLKENPYRTFSIDEEIALKNINFIGSGVLTLEEDSVKINKEQIVIPDFFGKIKLDSGKILLDGSVNEIQITGKNRKLEISK